MKLGFRRKIFLGFFTLLLIQGMVMFFWVNQVMKAALLEEIKSHGHSTGVNLSARIAEPMLAMDFLRLGLFQTRVQKAADKITICVVVTIILAGIVGTFLLNPVVKSIEKLHESTERTLRGDLDVRRVPGLKSAGPFLNEQKAYLQTILDAVPDFISLQDYKGRFICVNNAFCEMLDKDRQQILGKTNKDLFPEKFARVYNSEDQALFETGVTIVKENRLETQRGVKWLHVVKILVPASNNMDQRLVCSGRDITPLKNVQEQLTHAQKMESVGRLAAGVAHEINTPLGIILGYAQLIMEDVKGDELIFQDVQTIVRQTKNCSKIVKDLLNFSRSSKRVISRFDMDEAVKEVIDVIGHTFNLNRVVVEHEYDETINLFMKGDKEKIKQVLINLLTNALDAVQKNGSIVVETKPVKAISKKNQNGIEISISDTGHGIAKEDIDKIFEPFYTTKAPDQGTGLGLSVTFGIIKEHHGTIKAFSPSTSGRNRGKGTQFIIALPRDLNYT